MKGHMEKKSHKKQGDAKNVTLKKPKVSNVFKRTDVDLFIAWRRATVWSERMIHGSSKIEPFDT